MSVEEKVKEIIVDQLGVDEKQVKSEASLLMIWVPIPWTP